MAANQVGHPRSPAAPGSAGQSCPAAWVLLSRCSLRPAPAPPLVPWGHRAGAGWAALLRALPPAVRGLLPCAPSFSRGFGWWQQQPRAAAAWHVLLRPCSPGEAAAGTPLPPSITAARCGDLPPYLHPPCLSLTCQLSGGVCLSRGCPGLPPHRPGCCVGSGSSPLQLPDPCVSEGHSAPCQASRCRAAGVTHFLCPFADVLPDPAAHLLLPSASLPQERGLPLGPVQVTGHRLGARALQDAVRGPLRCCRAMALALHLPWATLPRSSRDIPALLALGPQEEQVQVPGTG